MARTRSIALETPTSRWNRCELELSGGTALYRAHGTDGSLLYIGVTTNPVERWRTHARKAPWWGQTSHITFTTFGKNNDALDAERHAIRDEKPVYNKRSTNRAGHCEVACSICAFAQEPAA